MAFYDLTLLSNEVPHMYLSKNYLEYSRKGYKMRDYVTTSKRIDTIHPFKNCYPFLNDSYTHYTYFNDNKGREDDDVKCTNLPDKYYRNNIRYVDFITAPESNLQNLDPDSDWNVYSEYLSHKYISSRAPLSYKNLSESTSRQNKFSDKFQTHVQSFDQLPVNRFVPLWPEHKVNRNFQDKPLFMSTSDPRKYYVSGYTGHVPRLKFTYGMTYPTATNQALCQFTKERSSQKIFDNNSIISSLAKPSKSKIREAHIPNHALPFLHTGLIPRYTGHIPGYKFICGDTFGKATLKLSGAGRYPSRRLF
ncbi:uncharacterized protein LOC111641241 isoform X1 [Centruroides sculpturatus]|uniref:uncharacterized protein LOC111641241 isoform X1 n=2 Tax=Centruroides sculpturatus TaxID=218467 RepID=UPI000C6EF4C1|nr:uncharacterized protein LOC111641241 isoform X1 [Centruroides sculpturatus]